MVLCTELGAGEVRLGLEDGNEEGHPGVERFPGGGREGGELEGVGRGCS
jgi:hypothetical protein